MKVLNENLSEGQAPPTAQEVKALPSTTSEVEAAVVPSRACNYPLYRFPERFIFTIFTRKKNLVNELPGKCPF